MRIVRKYYDQFKNEMDDIRRKRNEEEAAKTPEETANEKVQLKREIEAFINEIKESERDTCLVPDEQKKADFDMMCKFALLMAKYLELNIEINTDNKKYSTIEFTMEQLFMVDSVPREIRAMMGMMFLWADETWVDQKESFISFLFFFHVSDGM